MTVPCERHRPASVQRLAKIPSELSSATLQRLSDIGVTLQKDGKLSVDSAKLTMAIGNDLNGVASTVAAYGGAFKTAAAGLVGTGGLIAARSEAQRLDQEPWQTIRSNLQPADADRSALSETVLALDTAISGMTKTSNFLAQQLANLPTYNT